ncbi:MAG: YeeE/YedE thiosulfate transporter family protein [Kangiellaceae bacterium]|jgi:hypothetical protein|nr:YeeE/YedE thiosulfate transporter family protein [Kangiellaceae bacterium]
MQVTWGWFRGGLTLGIVFLMAVILVKPLGVSTQFVIVDGIVAEAVNDDLIVENEQAKHGYESSNAYLNKSGGKYAKNVEEPVNYGLVLVLSMLVGGFLSAKLQKNKLSKEDSEAPQVFRATGKSNRYIYTFLGGVLTLFGARLAGGCTSGHMMSGMMQTSLSGYLFAAGAFAAGIPLAILFYKAKKGAQS